MSAADRTQREDGGAGVPVPTDVYHTNLGMTLRDYFAGQALAGLIAHYGYQGDPGPTAYQIADTMLAARSRP